MSKRDRINIIKKRLNKFEYGLAQADFDVTFLLRVIDEFCQSIDKCEGDIDYLKHLNDSILNETKEDNERIK